MAATDQPLDGSRHHVELPTHNDASTSPNVEPSAGDSPPGGFGQRLKRPQTIISFALAIGIVGFLITRLDIDLAVVWDNVRNANPWLFGLALLIYYSTFALRAVRWKWMLAQAEIDSAHGYRLPGIPRLGEIMILSWFVNCIIPAKLGDGYRCYLLKRDTGASFSATLGTILAERLTDLVVLFFTMTIAGLIAFHGDLPSQVTHTLLIGVVLIGIGVAAVLGVGFGRDRLQRLVPKRFHGQFETFHSAIFACLRNPLRPTLISLVVWALDGTRLFLVAAALGAGISYPLAVFVALMAALLTTLPITPAGLGVVEAAVIVVLKLVDMDADMASSIAILDRLIGYWSLIVVGLVIYFWRLKNEVTAVAEPASA